MKIAEALMTQKNLKVPSSAVHRVLKKSVQANFALQLHNFDERTALCLLIHLAKKDPMADEKRSARNVHHDVWPCKNNQVCHPSPCILEGFPTMGNPAPNTGGAADQHPKTAMDQRRWNRGSAGS